MIREWVVTLLCLAAAISEVESKDRVYYLAIQEIIWDYAPSGINLITNNRLEDEPISRIYSHLYIGKRYKKAVYRGYTDATFSTPLAHDPNLGFMGPTLRAEVGDRVVVHLFNNASREYSLHPHGLFYPKEHEGARYQDNNTAKADDAVPSGGRYTYEWEARPEFGPAQDDANCLTWAYHSHTNSPKDINSGLIGALIVCRRGTYHNDDSRTDVDHEFVAMFFIPYERDSWYFWENLKTIPDWETVDINARLFDKGNKMHVVNAYMYGNTPGYDVCQGDRISWHVLGMGSDRDLHPIQFQGQTVSRQHHREDSMIVIPATFSTLLMRANNPGRWLVACKLYSHFTEGMTSWLTVDPACRNRNAPLPSDSLTGTTREYFIAAEEMLWNYGPAEINLLTNTSLVEPGSDSEVFFERGTERIGGIYKKAVFRKYMDDTFTSHAPRQEDLGVIGPVIAGEIGDKIKVVFKNSASHRAYNIEPHGVYFQDTYPVFPKSQRTYTWTLPDDVAPNDRDPNCLTYIYTSSVSYVADTNSGLIGPLIVCKRGTLEAEMQKSNKFIMMKVFDENKSWYFQENMERTLADPSSIDVTDGDFEESNLMHSINGLMYGNFELDLCSDADTNLHVLSVGTKVDIHGLDLEGINARVNGVNTGVVAVFAHTAHSVSIRPEYTGIGRLFCRTIDHTITGMSGIYKARKCNQDEGTSDDRSSSGQADARDPPYYIAAEEVIWDYSKRRVNIHGDSVDVPGNSGYKYSYHQRGSLIGSRYKKVLYFEYTDDTFSTRKPKPAHLGTLGPIVKGQVGETISIVFRNNAKRSYNMFPWGAIDPSANTLNDQAVNPGETKRYYWKIPESAGPKRHQPACQSFVYVSSVDAAIDPIDGLMGPLLVCKKGSFPSTSSLENPVDVDKEFYLQFLIVDENLSHYIDDNIRDFLGVDPATFDQSDEFVESNKMKAINGFLWHVDDLKMLSGDLVRWHLIGWGNEKDYHSVHFHAHTFLYESNGAYRGDAFDVFPGSLGTVEMRVIEAGNWLLHCHVFDHLDGGMQTVYSVVDRDAPEEDNESPVVIPRRDTCEIRVVENQEEFLCNNMNITSLRDVISPKTKQVKVIFPNGTLSTTSTSRVKVLDLSNSHLTSSTARKILRFLHDLSSVNLNGNQLTRIPGQFFLRNRMLRTLRVRKNPNLQVVSRGIVSGTPKRGIPPHNFTVLDFSENKQLQPSCLNQLFTQTEHFLACFTATHKRKV